jgi:hypothetical protein
VKGKVREFFPEIDDQFVRGFEKIRQNDPGELASGLTMKD